MKQKLIDAYMKTAEIFAELSHARRLHVGAIVVKDDRIISIGYNGMPAGWDNNCEDKEYMSRDAGGWLDPNEIYEQWPFEEEPKIQWFGDDPIPVTNRYKLKTKPEVLHAETNAIAKLAKSNESGMGATMFITHAPCLDCAKLIYQSGIGSVLYRNAYRDTSGVTFLEKSGIDVTQVKKDS
jgi:dCMP deaminase